MKSQVSRLIYPSSCSFSVLFLFGVLVFTGCASRTSPQTVSLKSIRKIPSNHSPLQSDSTLAVAIRFPAGFASESAKLLFTEKAKLMGTVNGGVSPWGTPMPEEDGDPSKTDFNPDETIAKSFFSALQIREAFLTNSKVKVFLVPCAIYVSNGLLQLKSPSPATPPTHAQIDLAILNPMVHWDRTPFYFWQGVHFGRQASPMVRVSITDLKTGGSMPVAGTQRWMNENGEVATVLPEVLYRRFKGCGWGSEFNTARNYPEIKPSHPEYRPSNKKRPANLDSYYQFPSFMVGDYNDHDYSPYWRLVAAVTTDVLANFTGDSSSIVTQYATDVLGLPSADKKAAAKFLDAEYMFLTKADSAVSQKLDQVKWMDAMRKALKAEDELVEKIQRDQSKQQWMLAFGSLAGGVTAGITTAVTGATYSPQTAIAMGQNLAENANSAVSASQKAAYNIYNETMAASPLELSAVALGLSEDSANVRFTTLEQVRDLARRTVPRSN